MELGLITQTRGSWFAASISPKTEPRPVNLHHLRRHLHLLKAWVPMVPIQNHPLFSTAAATISTAASAMEFLGFTWDSHEKRLHRIPIPLGEPDLTSILAASPSKEYRAYVPFNRNGSALFLARLEGLCFMYFHGCLSMEENTIISRFNAIKKKV
ncbi:hypothetical protein Pfo_015206 [Paulownia fortunei]|nr:hypothetical protein Pfo_015206 [Paulownia fortunei]